MKVRNRIRVKRVYEKTEQSDGARVLIDRLWPRGVRKQDARIDAWMKEITPSTKLRQWLHKDPTTRWNEFSKRYGAELAARREQLDVLRSFAMGKGLTLVTAAKDIEHSHVPVLLKRVETVEKKCLNPGRNTQF